MLTIFAEKQVWDLFLRTFKLPTKSRDLADLLLVIRLRSKQDSEVLITPLKSVHTYPNGDVALYPLLEEPGLMMLHWYLKHNGKDFYVDIQAEKYYQYDHGFRIMRVFDYTFLRKKSPQEFTILRHLCSMGMNRTFFTRPRIFTLGKDFIERSHRGISIPFTPAAVSLSQQKRYPLRMFPQQPYEIYSVGKRGRGGGTQMKKRRLLLGDVIYFQHVDEIVMWKFQYRLHGRMYYAQLSL